MKKIKVTLSLLFILVVTLLLLNCDNENLDTNITTLTPELIGEIHNEALDNILKNEDNFNFKSSENEFKAQIFESNNLCLRS